MVKFLVLLLVGLAFVQLASSVPENEEEKEISMLQNEESLEIQELADPKKCRGKKGKNCRRKKKGRKAGKNKNMKKRNGRKNKRKGRKNRKGKKKQRKAKKNKRKKAKKNRNGKKKSSRNGGKSMRQADCETGCSDVMLGMMKAARKQNTFLKQYNRIINGQKQAAKKGGKKGTFESGTKDGPLNLLLSAGGGNVSELSCAGDKTNKAAKNMTELAGKLAKCTNDIDEACNATTKFVKVKDEWKDCNTTMITFKVKFDACLKKTGVEVCNCFKVKDVLELQANITACNATDMKMAASADLKAKRACVSAYGACRQNGEAIRPLIASCAAGGPTVSDIKKDLGNALKNNAALEKVNAKTASLQASASRNLRNDLTTCTGWVAAADAWLTTLASDVKTDVSADGETTAAANPDTSTCDATALGALAAAGAAAAAKLEAAISVLQEQLEKITGTTAATDDAIAAAGGTTAMPGGASTNSMRLRRKVHRILKEFRNRL